MKRKILLFVTFALILAMTVVPVQAADQVINLIDEDGATWTKNAANGNDITTSFANDKLVATAPGAWPWVTAVLDTPIVLNEDDDATINLTFTVSDATACSSIRLTSGSEAIYLHHFISGATYDGSGDIDAGTYTLSISVFDLQAFAGTAEDVYLGKKALVLDGDGNLTIDGFQVWCAGASTDITVTIDTFEIVIPDTAAVSDDSEESEESDASVVSDTSTTSEQPVTGDSGLVGLYLIVLAAAAFTTILSKKRA